MAFTKEVVLDRIEIVNDMKDIQIREAIIIKEDGVELSRTNHRRVLESLTGVDDELNPIYTDLSGEDPSIVGICSSVWTPEVVELKRAHFAAIKPTPYGMTTS